MDFLIQDVPALEVQLLRLLQQSLGLIEIKRKFLKIAFLVRLLPQFDQPLLRFRIKPYDTVGDLPIASLAARAPLQ